MKILYFHGYYYIHAKSKDVTIMHVLNQTTFRSKDFLAKQPIQLVHYLKSTIQFTGLAYCNNQFSVDKLIEPKATNIFHYSIV